MVFDSFEFLRQEKRLNDISVLHVGNPAGVASIISSEQEKIGMKSDVIVFNKKIYDFKSDEVINTWGNLGGSPKIVNDSLELVKKAIEIQKRISDYDVIHFHYRSVFSVPCPLLPHGMDLPIWSIQNKTVVMHFHGSDIRWKDISWFYREFSDAILVATPDLLHWAPDTATWVPTPIDTSLFDPYYPDSDNSKPIKIVHAPTNRETKGTQHVINAVSILKSRGYDIELQIVEDKPHSEAIDIYKTADIAVGWVNPDFGIYGMFSKEAMALGKPVVASLTQSVKKHLPNSNPIIESDPEDLIDELEYLINHRDQLKDYGKQSREYVENTHDISSVIQDYNRTYLV